MQAHSAKQSFTLQARLRKALHCHSYDGDIDCTDRDNQRAPCQFPACRSSINSAALHRLFWLFRKDANATKHSPLLQPNQTRQAFTEPTLALSRNEPQNRPRRDLPASKAATFAHALPAPHLFARRRDGKTIAGNVKKVLFVLHSTHIVFDDRKPNACGSRCCHKASPYRTFN